MGAAEEVEEGRETMLKNLVTKPTGKVQQEFKKLPRTYTRTVNYVIIFMRYWVKDVKSDHLCR